MSVTVHHGDCLDVLPTLAEASIDAVVCDPPYELKFMSRAWDGTGVAFRPETWAEVLRVMKPGAHLVAFSGTRTYHRMVCAIEDAGFEIRDQLAWLYGSGFPKSLDVGKAIDKAAGADREVVGVRADFAARANKGRGDGEWRAGPGFQNPSEIGRITAPATPEAARWTGWGTALKPSHEPIVLARKPLARPTVAAQVLATGTGALNVDGCRVPSAEPVQIAAGTPGFGAERSDGYEKGTGREYGTAGRWPANLVHDGSPEVLEAFAEQSARMGMHSAGRAEYQGKRGRYNASSYEIASGETTLFRYGDTGTAARFFYSAKASKAERAGSKHPTVKPLALMRWLCRLVTPPGGVVLDCFAGTGVTGEAAMLEGFSAVLVEREAEHVADIRRRLGRASGADTPLLSETAA